MLYELHILFILWNATQVFLYDYFRQLRDGGLCQRIFPQILLGRIYLHRILHCFPQLREVDVCQRIFASSCFTIAYLQSYLYGTNRKSLQFEHHIQKVLYLKRLIIGITIYNSVSPTWSTLYHWVLLFFFSPNSSSKNNRKKMMGSCRDRTSKKVKKVRYVYRVLIIRFSYEFLSLLFLDLRKKPIVIVRQRWSFKSHQLEKNIVLKLSYTLVVRSIADFAVFPFIPLLKSIAYTGFQSEY